MKRRIVALLMALSLLASVCVFTANAEEPTGVTVNSAAELIEALKTENAQITLGSDIVLNEGYTFAYDETNAVVTVSDANGIVAKISTGEAAGSTAGAVIEGSLDALTTWTPLENLNGADIDGAGFAIKGFYASSNAFVTRINVGESIKNLKFENSLVISNEAQQTATLTLKLYGDVYDLEFKNSYVIACDVPQYYQVGGAICSMYSSTEAGAETYNPTVDGVSFDGGVFANGKSIITAGGVVAQNKGGTVKNSENYATVKIVSGTAYAAGGIIGLVEPVGNKSTSGPNGTPRNAYIYNNANYGKIVSNDANAKWAGGIVGFIDVYWSGNEDVIFHNFYNAGEIVNGRELIGSFKDIDPSAAIGQTKLHYGFAPTTAANELLSPTKSFADNVLSVAKESNDKILTYLNHGATAYEGLKTWKIDGEVLKMTDTDATYDENFVAKDIAGPDYTTTEGGVKVESVKVLNETQIEITFSEDVVCETQPYMAIRYTDDKFTYHTESGKVLQFEPGSVTFEGNKAIFNYSPTRYGNEGKSLYEVLTLKDREDSGYYVHFCFEGKPVTGFEIADHQTGYIDNIVSAADPDKRLATNKPNGSRYEGLYVVIEDIENAKPASEPDYTTAEGGVKVESVKVIDETHIEITFSEDVLLKGKPFAAIRYTNINLALQTDPNHTPTPHLQYSGSFLVEGNKATFIHYPSTYGGKSLYDILTMKGYEDKGYFVSFCIEGMEDASITEPVANYVDNVVSAADPTKLLAANLPGALNIYDGCYTPIEDIEKAKPEETPTGPDYTTTEGGVKVESVKVLNETQIEITFSENVVCETLPYMAIRYTNDKFTYHTESGKVLQFEPGSVTFEGNKAIFNYSPTRYGNEGKSLYEVLTLKGREDSGYYVHFCFEGLPVTGFEIEDHQTGYIDNIVSAADPDKRLAINKSGAARYEGLYVVIEDIEKAKPAQTEPDYTTTEGGVKVVSAKVINETQIEIVFSENVSVVSPRPYIAIRYVTIDLAKTSESGKVLQFEPNSVAFDGNKAIFNYSPTRYGNEGKTLYEVLTKKDREDTSHFVALCFEGLAIEGYEATDYQVGYIDNIVSAADPDKRLAVNKPYSNNINDALYVPVEDIDKAKPGATPPPTPPVETPNYTTTEGGVKVESVKVIDEIHIEVTFSEDVVCETLPYIAIRYTNAKFAYRTDNGKVLQFEPSSVSFSGNKAIFTYSPTRYGNEGKTLYEVLTLKGREDLGYYVHFCFEGLPIEGYEAGDYQTGYIDNIVSAADPDKRLATNRANGTTYEGLYIVIEDIENAKLQAQPDYTTTEDGVKVESVKVLNETQIEITFSEDVVASKDLPYIAIRYTDVAFGKKSESGKVLQFEPGSVTFEGNKAIFNYNPTRYGNNGMSLYEVLTFNGREDLGYYLHLCFEGKPIEGYETDAYQIGYIDNIVSAADPNKRLATNKPNGSIYEGLYVRIEDIEKAAPPAAGTNPGEPTVDMTPTQNGITILSAKAINEKQIEITFSEPVKKIGNVYSAIRYTNSSLKLAHDYALEGETYLQFYGDMTFNGTDKAIYTFNSKDNRTLYDILNRRGYESKNYYVYFCIEGLAHASISNPVHGYIDNITSLDGTKLLSSNKPSVDGKGLYDGYYVEIEDGNVSKPDGYVKKPIFDVEALSAKVLNEKEIEVEFSEAVNSVGSVYAAIRYVDENNALRYDGSTPLQFDMSIRFNGSKKAIFTLKDTNTLTMEEIFAFKGYEDMGYVLKFCLEGISSSLITTGYLKGYIDNVQTFDGKGMLLANKESTDKIYDGLYLDIEDIENATVEFTEATTLPTPDITAVPIDPELLVVPDNSVKILSVQIVNSTQLKVVFSEQVENISWYYKALRYVDNNLKLKTDNGKHLQWDLGSPIIDGNTWTFVWNHTDISMKDVINLKGYEGLGYHVMFCLEGYPSTKITKPKVGYIDNCVGVKSKKLLGANLPKPDGIYDGVYAALTGHNNLSKPGPKPGEVPIENRPNFTLVSAKVINPSQIELIFSEPVKRHSSFYSAIRYTDKEMVVQTDKTVNPKEPWLQWAGSAIFDGTERVVWNLSSSFDKTLYEILNFKDYENKGYYLYFCIEGLPNATAGSEPGYIDNIQSLDGKKKLKGTPARASKDGVYDGIYVKIENMEKAKPIEVPDLEGIFVDQIEALSNYQLELKFSEPVYVVGMGNESTQFNALKASVRYVDPRTYDTVTHNNLLMEFGADIYIEDGSTTGIFELRSQDKTLKQLFDMEGYDALMEKAIPVLSLEGTEDMKLIPLPYPGYIDNIQNEDGTNFLTSIVADQMGVHDVWIATAEEIKFEIRKSEIEQLKEFLATDKMTSEELEALNAMDEAELKETLTKAKELVEGLKSGEMTEAGVEAFNALLKRNGVDNAEKVKAMMFTVGETFNIGFPTLLNFDVSEREYSAADTVYVYRVNADGSVTEIAQKDLTVYVADEIITRIEFADSIIGDYFVTNSRLELPQPFNPIVIAYIAIGVMVLAIVALIIFLLAKKKKEKNA